MPCRDYESDTWGYRSSGESVTATEYKNLKNQADRLARIACKAMNAIEEGVPLKKLLEDKEIAKWWVEHKKADEANKKKEEAAEQKKKEHAALKAAVMKKLTEEELRAFGLLKENKK